MPTRPPRRHSAVLPSHSLGARGTCSSHRLSRARVHLLAVDKPYGGGWVLCRLSRGNVERVIGLFCHQVVLASSLADREVAVWARFRHLVSSRTTPSTTAFSPFPNVDGVRKLAVAPTLHMPCQARQGILPRKRAPHSLSAARGSFSLDLRPVAWLSLSAAAKRRHLSPHFCNFKWPKCALQTPPFPPADQQ